MEFTFSFLGFTFLDLNTNIKETISDLACQITYIAFLALDTTKIFFTINVFMSFSQYFVTISRIFIHYSPIVFINFCQYIVIQIQVYRMALIEFILSACLVNACCNPIFGVEPCSVIFPNNRLIIGNDASDCFWKSGSSMSIIAFFQSAMKRF